MSRRRIVQIAGTGGGGGTTVTYGPQLTAAGVTRNWVADGDSITAANSGADYPAYSMGQLSGVGGAWQCSNIAVPGQTIATIMANAPANADTKYDATKELNVYTLLGGTNDLTAGTSITTIHANIGTTCSGRRTKGFKVGVGTLTTRSYLTNIVPPTTVDALNALIRANWQSYADFLMDFASDVFLGTFPWSEDQSWYQSDELHPLATNARRRMANYVWPQIYALDPVSSGKPLIGRVFTVGGTATGASSGGTTVYMSGYNLAGATATLNGSAVTLTTVDANHVSFVAPAHTGTSGALQIAVTNNGKTQTPSYATYTYAAPVVASVAPTSVFTGGGTIAVTGTGFGPSCAVYLGTVDGAHQCTSVVRDTYKPELQLTCVTPAALAAGTYAVIVVNSDGTQSNATVNVTLTAPAAATVTGAQTENATTAGGIPVSVLTGGAGTGGLGSNKVVLTGTNFTGTTSVVFGGVSASSFTVDSPTQITAVPGDATATLGSSGGMTSVVVTNGSGASSPFANALYYLPSATLAFYVLDRGVTLSGSTVSTVNDGSGSGNNMAAGAVLPNFVASAVNGRPGWHADGVNTPNKYLVGTLGSTYSGTTVTAIMVGSRTSGTGTGQIMAGYDPGSTTSAQGSVTAFATYDVPGSDVRSARNSAFLSQLNTPLVNGTPFVLSTRFTGSACITRESGVDATSSASTGTFVISKISAGIGYNLSTPASAVAGVDITFFLLSSKAWGTADFTSFSAYTNAQFGIANA